MVYISDAGDTEYFPTGYFTDGAGLGWIRGRLTHFSDYAIVYDESRLNEDGKTDSDGESGSSTEKNTANGRTSYRNGIAINKGLKVSQTGSKINVSWGKVSGADRYEVYAAYCGKKYSKKPTKTIMKKGVASATIKKLDGRKTSRSTLLHTRWWMARSRSLGKQLRRTSSEGRMQPTRM